MTAINLNSRPYYVTGKTVWDNGKPIYSPTVHYAYCPADVAINSLHELEMRQFDLQEKQRVALITLKSGIMLMLAVN